MSILSHARTVFQSRPQTSPPPRTTLVSAITNELVSFARSNPRLAGNCFAPRECLSDVLSSHVLSKKDLDNPSRMPAHTTCVQVSVPGQWGSDEMHLFVHTNLRWLDAMCFRSGVFVAERDGEQTEHPFAMPLSSMNEGKDITALILLSQDPESLSDDEKRLTDDFVLASQFRYAVTYCINVGNACLGMRERLAWAAAANPVLHSLDAAVHGKVFGRTAVEGKAVAASIFAHWLHRVVEGMEIDEVEGEKLDARKRRLMMEDWNLSAAEKWITLLDRQSPLYAEYLYTLAHIRLKSTLSDEEKRDFFAYHSLVEPDEADSVSEKDGASPLHESVASVGDGSQIVEGSDVGDMEVEEESPVSLASGVHSPLHNQSFPDAGPDPVDLSQSMNDMPFIPRRSYAEGYKIPDRERSTIVFDDMNKFWDTGYREKSPEDGIPSFYDPMANVSSSRREAPPQPRRVYRIVSECMEAGRKSLQKRKREYRKEQEAEDSMMVGGEDADAFEENDEMDGDQTEENDN